jgi:hypothetical protein
MSTYDLGVIWDRHTADEFQTRDTISLYLARPDRCARAPVDYRRNVYV